MILEQVNDAVIALDLDLRILTWNKAAEMIYGWHAVEVIGKLATEIIPVIRYSEAGVTRDAIMDALRWDGYWKGQVVQQHRDGHELIIDRSTRFMRDERGEPIGTVSINRDITERKQGEEELRRSEARNRAMLAAIPDMIFLISADGQYLDFHANDRGRLYTAPSTFVGKNVRDIMPAEIAAQSLAAIARTLATGTMQIEEYRLAMLQGARDFEVRLVTSGPAEVLGIVRDITERKQAEQALLQSEERFRQLAENIREVFWVADARTMRRIYVSPAYEEIWGRSRERLLEDPYSLLEAIHPEDRERIRAAQTKQPEGTYDEEYRIVRPDGELRWIWARAAGWRAPLDLGTCVPHPQPPWRGLPHCGYRRGHHRTQARRAGAHCA
jgi:PAS domain S-box-containing protein